MTIAPPKIRWKCPVTHCVLWIVRIELIAHVDQAAGAAEAQHDEGAARPPSIIGLRQGSAASQPSAPLPPRSRPAISTDAQIVNTVSSVGSVTSAVNTECRNLKPDADLRVREQVVHADRHRDDQEQDEGDAPHRVAEQPPADRARNDRVIGDVGRHQPEIDDRVQRPGEEHAREAGVDRRCPGRARPAGSGTAIRARRRPPSSPRDSEPATCREHRRAAPARRDCRASRRAGSPTSARPRSTSRRRPARRRCSRRGCRSAADRTCRAPRRGPARPARPP